MGTAENGTDDEFQFEVVKEIWKGYPLYIIKYGLRNLWLTLFDPGWSNPRYSKAGFNRQGVEFVGGAYGWGAYSTDTVTNISEKAAREHELYQLKLLPQPVIKFFDYLRNFHVSHFRQYVYITGIPMVIGWSLVLIFYIQKLANLKPLRYDLDRAKQQKLNISIILISMVLLYENAMTAWFSQPHFRYFHMMEPCRLLLIGLCVYLISQLGYLTRFKSYFVKKTARKESSFYLNVDASMCRNRGFVVIFAILLTLAFFASWVINIKENTWGNYQVTLKHAALISNSGERSDLSSAVMQKIPSCPYFKCSIEMQPSLLGVFSNEQKQNLELEYYCLRNNIYKVTKANFRDEKLLIEYDCY